MMVCVGFVKIRDETFWNASSVCLWFLDWRLCHDDLVIEAARASKIVSLSV